VPCTLMFLLGPKCDLAHRAAALIQRGWRSMRAARLQSCGLEDWAQCWGSTTAGRPNRRRGKRGLAAVIGSIRRDVPAGLEEIAHSHSAAPYGADATTSSRSFVWCPR
jgi:hypothetical protein